MELGATVCTPKSPLCLACPVVKRCAGFAAGDPETLPIKAKKAKPKKVEAVAALALRRGKALAVRRPPSGLLGGLWELPGDDLGKGEKPDAGLPRAFAERVGLRVAGVEKVGHVEHVFTHRLLRLHVFRVETIEGRTKLQGFDAHRWLSPTKLAELPSGAVTKKALALLGLPDGSD